MDFSMVLVVVVPKNLFFAQLDASATPRLDKLSILLSPEEFLRAPTSRVP